MALWQWTGLAVAAALLCLLVRQQQPEIARLCAQKKEQDTQDVLAYMGKQSDLVCDIIGKGLTALAADDKLAAANPAQITTAIGTLIDKWTMVRDRQTQSGVQVDLGGAEEYSE